MPLDSTNWSQTETETKPDLSKPSLEGLSWLLRHMPATHQWNFMRVGGRHECGSAGCALGLAKASWPKTIKRLYRHNKTVWDIFPSLTKATMELLFTNSGYKVSGHLITPQMVADRIDEFLRSRNRDAYLAETRK